MNTPARVLICLSAVLCWGPPALRADQKQDQEDKTAEALRHMEEGREALRFGDLKAAKKEFRLTLKLERKLPLANFALGLVYHREDDFKNAVKYYKKEAQYFPKMGQAFLNWGACAAIMNQHPRAVLAFVDAVRRLGAEEQYVNNLGKAIYVLRRETEDEGNLSTELRRALQTYEELEAHLNAKLAQEGMTRWGATKITLEQKRDIEERIMRYDQMIQDQVLQIQEFVFEANTVRHRINELRMSLREYRDIQSRRGPLEAEMTRLEIRLRDLEDNIRLARANIKHLEDQKPQPPWNEDYAFCHTLPAAE